MIQLREISLENDYPMFCKWWEGHGWSPVPKIMLPKLGIVVSHDGKDIVAGWLYMDNSSPISMLEWVVTNPEANPVVCVRSVSHMIEFITARAVELGYSVMMTACRHPKLEKLYERNGFEKTDGGVTHLIRVIRTNENISSAASV